MDWKFLFTSFEGRISRKQFWIGVLILAVAAIIVSFVVIAILGGGMAAGAVPAGTYDAEELLRLHALSGWGGLLTFALLAYPGYALSVKRRHDRNRSGNDVKLLYGLNALLFVLQGLGIGYSVEELFGETMVVPGPITGVVSFAVGIFGLYMFVVLGVLKGDPHPNDYGPSPVETR